MQKESEFIDGISDIGEFFKLKGGNGKIKGGKILKKGNWQ